MTHHTTQATRTRLQQAMAWVVLLVRGGLAPVAVRQPVRIPIFQGGCHGCQR